MIDDPYKVLGISKDATKDEIKRAYRQKAKQYHPDLHPDDPHATEKMNEINEAYDMLNNPEKYQRQRQTQGNPYGQNSYGNRSYGSQGTYGNEGSYGNQGSYGSQGGYGNQGDYQQNGYGGYGSFGDFNFDDLFGFGRAYYEIPRPSAQPGDSNDIRQAIDFINMRQFTYANDTLNGIISSSRDARWFYLSALANNGLGNSIRAMEQIQRAVEMAPQNPVYQQTFQALRQSGTSYTENGEGFQRYAEGMSRMCMSFCAMQFLCMCCRPC